MALMGRPREVSPSRGRPCTVLCTPTMAALVFIRNDPEIGSYYVILASIVARHGADLPRPWVRRDRAGIHDVDSHIHGPGGLRVGYLDDHGDRALGVVPFDGGDPV